MHFLIALGVMLLIAVFRGLSKRHPDKWYGDMLCVSCGYRWASRKNTVPGRCPKCGKRALHPVTINQPLPVVSSVDYTPVVPVSAPQPAILPKPIVRNLLQEQKHRHQELEHILHNRNISTEQKAFFVVTMTNNADATNLMHRLKVSDVDAAALLLHLELAGYVSAPDELGERIVVSHEI